MAIEHKDIVDAQRHEPKGISTAVANTVYVANGAGAGTWKAPQLAGQTVATQNQVFSSDGAGGGSWSKIVHQNFKGISANAMEGCVFVSDGADGFKAKCVPHGRVSFINIAAPYTLTYPASYTKVSATTTASGVGMDVTEGTNARLTYTGTDPQHFHLVITVSASQASGANRDIRFAMSKNGVLIPSSEVIMTTTTGVKQSTAIHADELLNPNDYLEVIAKNDGASGDIQVYTLYLFAMGMLGT